MPDLRGGEAALERIHRRFAVPVRYSLQNHSLLPIMAIRQHKQAGIFMDDQQNVRQLGFEIRKADLPDIPREGDALSENDGAGPHWNVIEYHDLDEVDAWLVLVDSPEVYE